MNGYRGMFMSGGKFLKEWQVKDKIIEWCRGGGGSCRGGVDQQNKGPVMSSGQSYVMPMTSCDVMWHHRHDTGGWGGLRGGGGHGKLTSLAISIIPHISSKINYIHNLCAFLPNFQWIWNPNNPYNWYIYKL